jgi:hypothetical protein
LSTEIFKLEAFCGEGEIFKLFALVELFPFFTVQHLNYLAVCGVDYGLTPGQRQGLPSIIIVKWSVGFPLSASTRMWTYAVASANENFSSEILSLEHINKESRTL